MKKIFIIILCLISISVGATKYYVSPTGTDGNYPTRGTLASPWLTWQWAFAHTTSGDTCYFRGGVYPTTNGYHGTTIYGVNGTAVHPTCFFAYQPNPLVAAEKPILECKDNLEYSGWIKMGMYVSNCSYLYFKGLALRNVLQNGGYTGIGNGWVTEYCSNMKYEQCTVSHTAGPGWLWDANLGTINIINCDAHHCCDTLSYSPGNNGDGFQIVETVKGSSYYFYGCRGWKCSDEPFGFTFDGTYIEFDNCWAIGAGAYLEGNAGGFKGYGTSLTTTEPVNTLIKNCIGAYCDDGAFNTNHAGNKWGVYNCSSYHNGYTVAPDDQWMTAYISWAADASYSIFRNNLDLDSRVSNSSGRVIIGAMLEDHNSWDGGVTITAADFISLDTTGMSATRGVDGSLPATNFMKLASESDLIDKGTTNVVGFIRDYTGTAPDMGAWEYGSNPPVGTIPGVATVSANTSINYALVQGNVYNDGEGIVIERGICWNTSINPTILNDTVKCGTGTGYFTGRVDPLLTNTTYHVRAYAINQYGTAYGDDIQFTTLSEASKIYIYSIDGKPLTQNGKIVTTKGGSVPQTVLVTGINVAGAGGATIISIASGNLQMFANVTPNNATDTTIVWSVTNESGQATISTGGLLTAVTDGTVTVRATANDVSGIYGTRQITLSHQFSEESIDIWGTGNATTISTDGGTLQMRKKTLPVIANDTSVIWTVTNRTGSASINSNGILTAIANGIVTPRATAHDGSGIYDTIQITLSNQVVASQIIADHTIVDRFDDIPVYYINEVKKMFVAFPGESHAQAYRDGLDLLETSYPTYDVNVTHSGTPEAYTASHLRFADVSWGDYSFSSGWIYDIGEEDWFTNATAIARQEAALSYCNANSLPLAAYGFVWCWDMSYNEHITTGVDPVYNCHWSGSSFNGPQGDLPWGLDAADQAVTGNSVCLDTYLAAMQAMIDYCTSNSISTKIIFTTGPITNYLSMYEEGYTVWLKHERIRDYVAADASRILFDYADILCYDDAGEYQYTPYTQNGYTISYPIGTPLNSWTEQTGHIANVGAIRLAKAMWWMLARIAGWDGN
jgi:hypothetical protein